MGMVSRYCLALIAVVACALPLLGQAQEAAASAVVGSGAASAPLPDAARGRRAFKRYCVVCHGAQGEGGLGPKLQGVSIRLTPEQIRHQIVEPRNTMPRLYPSPIDNTTLGDLIEFLGGLK
ncbi:MAG: hypothetical protein RLY71_26 [Pseudomonadota bacterium]|jgi:mono/diheme cytochrome c family protein